MSDLAISAAGLGKQYRIGGARAKYGTLRESIMGAVSSPFRRMRRAANGSSGTPKIWALRDVSFEVRHGDVVGIIGRNGAGKSTLLKILSRITEPTAGYVDVQGRVGSLLEVGTGFHPELTGRENVFLNGAILGMSRHEIARKLDEIVAFSEIEKFLDTPVKHYSSGMYVRLAFAVAAHLESEILVVDEVLAVGDFDFQNKCLQKMGNVARGGRTVLFVSHNIGTVQQLCNRAILLHEGKIVVDAPTASTVAQYLTHGALSSGERVWEPDDPRAPTFGGAIRLRAVRVLDQGGKIRTVVDVKEPVIVETEYEVLEQHYVVNVLLVFSNELSEPIFVSFDNLDSPWQEDPLQPGIYRARCTVPGDLFSESMLRVECCICTRPTSPLYLAVPDAVSFQVVDDRRSGGVRGNWTRDWPRAGVRPRLKWDFEIVEGR